MTPTPEDIVAGRGRATDAEFVAYFWSKTEKRGEDECWPWLGSVIPKDRRGTAIFRGRRCVAPRLAFYVRHGRWLRDGEFACHSCDNPNCVNPAHIWAGSNRDNCRDAQAKGRLQKPWENCPKGHPLDKRYKSGSHKGQRYCGTCNVASRKAGQAARANLKTGVEPMYVQKTGRGRYSVRVADVYLVFRLERDAQRFCMAAARAISRSWVSDGLAVKSLIEQDNGL